ncbi:MAG: DUF4190 domain-containing protein [Nitriliruptor sp.]
MSSPAAWHPDPSGNHEYRYWDGQRWTDHVADGGVAGTDPLPPAPGVPATSEDRDTQASAGTEPSGGGPGDVEPREAGGDHDPAWGSSPSADGPVWGGHPPSTGPAPGSPTWAGAATSTSSGVATSSLVLGILSLPLLIVFGLGALLGIAAIVTGIIAVRRTSRGEASGRGLAIGGIVTGAISTLLGVLIVIALIAFGFGFAGELEACIEETGSEAVCQERLERELRDRFLGP